MDFLKNLGMVLKLYLRVQSIKSGRNSFFILLFRIFSDFERKIFQTFGQKTSRNCKNLPSAWADEQFLALKNFQKFWTVLDFLEKPLARFSNFHLRVQSKNSGRNKFFILLFRIFSDFERNFFQTFGQKTSRSCQNYLLRVQKNSLWLEFF